MKTLKTILIALTLTLSLVSCSTDENILDDKCGIIQGTGMNYAFNVYRSYPAVMIVNQLNENTGNVDTYYLHVETSQEDDYLHGMLVPNTYVCMDEIITISQNYN